MKPEKRSRDCGGGDRNRATSGAVTSGSNADPSAATSSRSVTSFPVSVGRPSFQLTTGD